MDLRNWETFVDTGAAVVGALVEVMAASLTHPNPNPVLDSTSTDSNGMFEFTGLSDGPKDVKLTYQGKIRWMKGLARHSIDLAQGSDFTPADQNLLKNGGLEQWRRDTNITIGASTQAPAGLAWQGRTGSGDSMVVSRESSVIVPSSKYAAKLQYNHSSGIAYYEQILPADLAHQLRGLDVAMSVQIRQGVANNVFPFINDGGGDDLGLQSPGTDVYVTLDHTKTISLGADSLKCGIRFALSDTVYVDNVILVLGSIPPVFAPRGAGLDAGQMTYEMPDRMYTRQFLLGAS